MRMHAMHMQTLRSHTGSMHLCVVRAAADGRRRSVAVAAAAPAPPAVVAGTPQKPLVSGPPPGYDFRASTSASTLDVVGSRHPELQDLVDDGTLIVWRRPLGYTERQSDGYVEPQLVYLVGTAHVSAKSALDVERVVQAVRPDAVVVELCRSRAGLMTGPDNGNVRSSGVSSSGSSVSDSEGEGGSGSGAESEGGAQAGTSGRGTAGATKPLRLAGGAGGGAAAAAAGAAGTGGSPLQLGGRGGGANPLQLGGGGEGGGQGGFLPSVLRSVALGGQSALLLRVLLANLAGIAADELGVQGGGEFVAARREGEDVGAQIVLGDRPIEITLERAWEALSWRARLRLTWELVLAGTTGSADRAALLNEQLVESMKSDDAISAFFEQLGQRYPDLLGPLVHERDMYLAWSLRRSKAVDNASAVVGVVGRGHMRGVVHALGADSGELRFSDLVGGRNSVAGRRERAMKGFARLGVETALAAGAYALYTAVAGAAQ
ncbi:hypothetical protein FOA52_007690 [Chlamydomonas sp. UWO 241]|nr:hypothetical protein FOA52_007690 [Chlamydomonas sp. UWO 241]